MLLSVILVLLALFSCGELPLHPLNPEYQTFSCDFETGTIQDYDWTDYSLAAVDSFGIVTDPSDGTNRVGRFIVRNGDSPTTGTRAELGLSHLYAHGTEVFYAWRVYIDPASEDVDKWQLLGQWHDAPDPLLNEDWSGFTPMSPPVSVLYQNGRLSLVLRSIQMWGAGLKVGDVALPKGQWLELEFHIRWSVNADGFIIAKFGDEYITGSEANGYKLYGRNIRNKAGNFLRMGVYRDDTIASSLTVYYDDVRVARSLEDLHL